MKERLLDALHRALAKALAQTPQLSNSSVLSVSVAYSGGLDSSVLLHIADIYQKTDLIDSLVCNGQKFKRIALSACHVNHGISEHAAAWQAHCEQQCKSADIAFIKQTLNLAKTPQKSLEAVARDARYRFLDKVSNQSAITLLAQHQDDQAETVLLQIKRGTGIDGLSGMQLVHKNNTNNVYLRPFLQFTRADLMLFAKQQGLTWIEDESNSNIDFDRNFLRRDILPSLNKRWPAFTQTIARTADNCSDANTVIHEYMHSIGQKVEVHSHCISISQLSQYSMATQKMFLRYWLKHRVAIIPSKKQLLMIINMLEQTHNKSPHLRFKDIAIEYYRDSLHLVKLNEAQCQQTVPETFHLNWDIQKEFKLDKQYSLAPAQDMPCSQNTVLLPRMGVSVSFGASNLRFKADANRPSKTLKSWYQYWGVSPLQRQQVPVFHNDDEVFCVGLNILGMDNKYNIKYYPLGSNSAMAMRDTDLIPVLLKNTLAH